MFAEQSRVERVGELISESRNICQDPYKYAQVTFSSILNTQFVYSEAGEIS